MGKGKQFERKFDWDSILNLYFLGYSYNRIAEKTGIKYETVKTVISHARYKGDTRTIKYVVRAEIADAIHTAQKARGSSPKEPDNWRGETFYKGKSRRVKVPKVRMG